MGAVDVVTTSPAADAATVTMASANEVVEAQVCAFCSSTARSKKLRKGCPQVTFISSYLTISRIVRKFTFKTNSLTFWVYIRAR